MDESTDRLPAPSIPTSENLVHPDQDKLAALPPVPYAMELREGVIFVTERPPVNDPFLPSRERALYGPTPVSESRMDELRGLATYAGHDSVDSFIAADAPAEEIRQNAPPYLIRRLPEQPSALEALYEMKGAAMEQIYAARVLELARQLVADKLPPDLVAQEQTLALVDEDRPTPGAYLGRFGGHHLMAFSEKNITKQTIDDLASDSEVVLVAAHEFLHQRHAEVQGAAILAAGLPDTAPFNEIQTDDPWEAWRLRDQYLSEVERSPEILLRQRLCSHLAETIAYLGEGEIRGYLEDTRFPVGVTSMGEEANVDFSRTEHTWINYFAGTAPLGERSGIIRRLMGVDLRRFADLPLERVREIIDNPALVLG